MRAPPPLTAILRPLWLRRHCESADSEVSAGNSVERAVRWCVRYFEPMRLVTHTKDAWHLLNSLQVTMVVG